MTEAGKKERVHASVKCYTGSIIPGEGASNYLRGTGKTSGEGTGQKEVRLAIGCGGLAKKNRVNPVSHREITRGYQSGGLRKGVLSETRR